MLSRPQRARTPLLMVSFALASALLLAGCVTAPRPVTINLPEGSTLREPCPRAEIKAATVGDLGETIIRQEAAVGVCDARRAGLVAVIEAHKQTVVPAPWWRFWKPR